MVTDDQVWAAYQAFEDEHNTWRIIDFNGRGAVAVRDRMPLPDAVPSMDTPTFDVAFEKIDFRTTNEASRYVLWRALKAALETQTV